MSFVKHQLGFKRDQPKYGSITPQFTVQTHTHTPFPLLFLFFASSFHFVVLFSGVLIDFDLIQAASPDGEAAVAQPSRNHDKAWLARVWGGFDTKYMKPLLTHSKPTLIDTLPPCCLPVARVLTTSEQLQQVRCLNECPLFFLFF